MLHLLLSAFIWLARKAITLIVEYLINRAIQVTGRWLKRRFPRRR